MILAIQAAQTDGIGGKFAPKLEHGLQIVNLEPMNKKLNSNMLLMTNTQPLELFIGMLDIFDYRFKTLFGYSHKTPILFRVGVVKADIDIRWPKRITDRWEFVLGVLFILLVMYLRTGLVGLFSGEKVRAIFRLKGANR